MQTAVQKQSHSIHFFRVRVALLVSGTPQEEILLENAPSGLPLDNLRTSRSIAVGRVLVGVDFRAVSKESGKLENPRRRLGELLYAEFPQLTHSLMA